MLAEAAGARSTRGQENEAWALYKKIPSRGSWGDLSRDRYIICPMPVCLDYILRVCQSLWDSFLYMGKLHWFLYLLLSYFYDPGMFIFRWSSNFVEKVGENGTSCFLPCILLL